MKLRVTLFFILFPLFLMAQMPVSDLSKRTHAKQLKEGILLVQLPNSDKKIAKLREMGNEKLAKTEEKEIKKIRETIIDEFQNEWDFCEFYFFETSDLKDVFNKDHKYLLDKDLKPIKEFPSNVEIYALRYGTGNPNGEVYRYNGVGYQIRHLKDGELQTIKYDTFYHAISTLRLFLRSMRKNKRAGIAGRLNAKLHLVRL